MRDRNKCQMILEGGGDSRRDSKREGCRGPAWQAGFAKLEMENPGKAQTKTVKSDDAF